MTRKPLPFVIKPKLKFPYKGQRAKREIAMTLVAALSGCDGTILFADTEEVIGSYSTRMIDKLVVWDCNAFRLGIAGTSTDGRYADMLQSEILGALSRLPVFDMGAVKTVLSETLTEFYAKHIWPRTGEKPQMEYLLVIQPLPTGLPEVLQIAETAANTVPDEGYKTIGVGQYLADYVFKQIFQAPIPVSRGESISFLCAAGVYAAKEVRENIDGVGPVERVAVFTCNGEYDELNPVDISAIEENVSSIHEFLGYMYQDVMDAEKEDKFVLTEGGTESFAFVHELREVHKKWYTDWKNRRESREMLRDMYKKRAEINGTA